jgi:hypothetical protein
MLTHDELARRAGVDPWQLRDDLAAGNPQEITDLATRFARAAGDAELATSLTQEAADLTAQGYTVDASPVHDADAAVAATAQQLGNGGDTLKQIARILDTISDDLEVRIPAARTEVSNLERDLQAIDERWRSFVRDVNHHLSEEDRRAVRTELEADAVDVVRSHGNTVQGSVDDYESALNGHLRRLSDLGYLPPGELDLGPGDNRKSPDQILSDYQTDPDPDGTVRYPPPPLGLITGQKTITKTEARMLDDLGLLGTRDFQGVVDDSFGAAESRFPEEGQEDGHGDAFRHAYWNALMTEKYGADWADRYGTAHEGLSGNPADREAMDLYNNEVGRRIATDNPDASPEELADLVDQAVRRGEMVVIDGNGDLRYSNEVQIGQTGSADDPPTEAGDGDTDSSAGSTESGTDSGGSVTGSAGP